MIRIRQRNVVGGGQNCVNAQPKPLRNGFPFVRRELRQEGAQHLPNYEQARAKLHESIAVRMSEREHIGDCCSGRMIRMLRMALLAIVRVNLTVVRHGSLGDISRGAYSSSRHRLASIASPSLYTASLFCCLVADSFTHRGSRQSVETYRA